MPVIKNFEWRFKGQHMSTSTPIGVNEDGVVLHVSQVPYVVLSLRDLDELKTWLEDESIQLAARKAMDVP